MASSDKLNLGLDDIIRMNRSSSNRRGGRGGSGGGGGNRGMMRGRPTRPAGGNSAFRTRGGGGLPRGFNAQGGGRWKNDFYGNNNNQFRGGAGAGAGERTTGVNSTTKLLISNLDTGVTTEDIQELFEEVGAVRTARVHFDEDGHSLGTAEVIYERRADAVAAQKKYNTLNLDGRPMEINVVGGSDNRIQSARFQSNGRNQGGGVGSGFRNNNNSNNNNNRPRTGGRNQQQQQPRQNSNKEEEVSAEDLDADLEAYRAESKQKK